MGAYRFRYWAGGKPVYEDEVACAGEAQALDHAKVFASEFDVEIWDGQRFVMRVEKDAPPAGARPAQG